MNYLQVSEVGGSFPDARIIMLADGDEDTETLAALEPATEAVLEQVLSDAEVETDGYLQGRFVLPVSPVSARLKLAVKEIFLYRMFARKPELWPQGGNPMADQYASQVEWLEGVKESDMFIGSTSVAETDSILSTADDGEGAGLVFGNGGLDSF